MHQYKGTSKGRQSRGGTGAELDILTAHLDLYSSIPRG